MWMWLGLCLLPSISLKLRRLFSHIGARRQFAAISKQVAVTRWGCWEEAVRSQIWQEQLLELQWHCKTPSSLCSRPPAITMTSLLQPPHQDTSFALARALFCSFSFCCINLQLLPYLFHTNDLRLVMVYLTYSPDHSSPPLPFPWSLCRSLQVKHSPLP